MSVLALVILGSVTLVIVLTARSLVLNTRLQDSLQREQEIAKQVVLRTAELDRANADLKLAQQQAYQQEKMASIGQLAAGVAHEINNPLSFVISNLGVLGTYVDRMQEFIGAQRAVLDVVASPEQRSELAGREQRLKLRYILNDTGNLLQESRDGAGRVQKIVQNLKGFARLDEAECKLADINAGLENTINIVANELKTRATVKKDLGPIPQVLCNLGQLNQVFMNLLVNAAQALDSQGVIVVKTRLKNDRILVSIADTGKGIPPEIRNRIFEPFFTTKPVGKGTGLGLSVSYDIVKKHQGEITVQSELDKGTTFTVMIPVNGQAN